MEVSLGRQDGSRRCDQAEPRELRPAARPDDAAHAVPGVRADPDRLRQVLHLLHRAQRPRPGAEPPAGADRRRGPAAGRPGLQGDHAAGPDRQQLPAHRRADAHGGSPTCCTRCTRSTACERIKFVTNYPQDMTDDLLAAVRDLPKCRHVPARAGAERLRTSMLRRMKRGYTVGEYREMLDRIREWMPDAAVTSDFIVGFCGETEDGLPADGGPGPRVPVQEQLHLQVQRAARHEGRRAVCRTTCPEDVKRRRNNELLAAAERDQRGRQPAVRRPQRRGAGRRPEQGEPRSARRPAGRCS